jgi:hypothetical protein
MGKVGRFITDPKAGAYCQIVLDSGEKILVNHDKGGFKGGRLDISQSKWLGLSGETVFECDLDSAAGRAALAHLTRGVDPQSVRATPLGAFVEYVKDCKDVADVKARCAALMAQAGSWEGGPGTKTAG